MSKELENFLNDLMYLVQEKYNDSLRENQQESEGDRAYRLGTNFAYYDVADLIKSQALAFGMNTDFLEKNFPVLGKK